MIPETNTTSIDIIDESLGCIDRADKDLVFRSDDVGTAENNHVMKDTSDLSESLDIHLLNNNKDSNFQLLGDRDSSLNPNARVFRSDMALRTVCSSLPDTNTACSEPSLQNHSWSERSRPELKSGVLVWISHGDHPKNLMCNGCKNNIVNNNYLDSIKPSVSSTVTPCRITVMMKAYSSSSGSYALMTPSRSPHRQAQQPLYLRLKNCHVTISDRMSQPMPESPSNRPCCFILTLNDRDGRSFKFEASTERAAREWVQAMRGDAFTTSPKLKTANARTSSVSTRLAAEHVINTCASADNCIFLNNDDDNKKNNNVSMVISTDAQGISSHLFITDKRMKNQRRPVFTFQTKQPVMVAPSHNSFSLTASQRDMRMPTVSESSDENEEDLSEED